MTDLTDILGLGLPRRDVGGKRWNRNQARADRDKREVAAHIGPIITYDELKRATEGVPKSEAYREASRLVELAVRKLAPSGSINRGPAAPSSTGKLTAESVMTPESES